jgi:hypothetical protein
MKDFLFSHYSNERVQVLLYVSTIHNTAYMEALFLFTENMGNHRKHSGSCPCVHAMSQHCILQTVSLTQAHKTDNDGLYLP